VREKECTNERARARARARARKRARARNRARAMVRRRKRERKREERERERKRESKRERDKGIISSSTCIILIKILLPDFYCPTARTLACCPQFLHRFRHHLRVCQRENYN